MRRLTLSVRALGCGVDLLIFSRRYRGGPGKATNCPPRRPNRKRLRSSLSTLRGRGRAQAAIPQRAPDAAHRPAWPRGALPPRRRTSRCARHALRGCRWPFEKCLQCRVLPHFKFPRSASVQGENGLDVALQQGLLLPPVCTFRPCSGFDGALRALPRLLVAGAGTGHFGRSPFPARVRSTFCSTFTSLARLELGDPGRAHSLCHLRGASSTSALRIAVRRRPPSAGAVLQQRHHRLRGRAARAWREYQHEARISKSRRAPGVEGRLEGRCRRRCGGTCGGIIPPPQFRGSRRRWRLRPRLHHRRGGQWRKHPGPHHRRLTSR